MTKVAQYFIELLQVALGRTDRLSGIPTEKQWFRLFQMSMDHSMQGIVFAGIQHLPSEQLPPLKVKMLLHGQSEMLKVTYDRFERILVTFAQLMDANNVQYVLFKGLAVASQYRLTAADGQPVDLTKCRNLGDFDFYVPASDFNRAVGIIETELQVTVNKDDIDKHFDFEYEGCRFEMHYQMETFGWARHQRYFSALMDRHFSSEDALPLVSFMVHDVKVPMLSPASDLLLVFKHWFTHLLGEGVGLRQTTDLAILVAVYQGVVDATELKDHLSAIGYLKAFEAVLALVDRYYGIRWEGWALSSVDYAYADKLMSDVIANGNFGRKAGEHLTGKDKRVETTKRFFRHCFRYFALAKMDILMSIPLRIMISVRSHS